MKLHFAFLGLGDPTWLDPAMVGAILLISLAVAWIFNRFVYQLLIRVTRWTSTDLDTIFVGALRLPLSLGVLLLGIYLALTVPLDLNPGQHDVVVTVVSLAGIVLGIFVVSSLISGAFDWYAKNIAGRTETNLDDQLIPLFRRVAVVLIYGLGALLVLDQLNVNINPLIAGLGIGGLAVALAIQPTLANLFAGTYVMTEGVISAGDFIELENGMSGYVIDVGWRSTRIRTFQNNLVVIPNSRFAETIFTNYQRPIPAVNVLVECGVSYDSDLYHVEQVCREVMDEVLAKDLNANKDFGGFFGYDSFGDSNINFWLFVQAKDRRASFGLKNALMQLLHHRFKELDIVINYPVRTLQFAEGESSDSLSKRLSGQSNPGTSQPLSEEIDLSSD